MPDPTQADLDRAAQVLTGPVDYHAVRQAIAQALAEAREEGRQSVIVTPQQRAGHANE